MILTAFVSKIRSGMQPSGNCSFLIYKTIYLYFQQENHKKMDTCDLHIPRELERQPVQVFAFFRSSRPKVFCEKGFLKYFVIFTIKHLCWTIFLIKLQAFRNPAVGTTG